MTAAQDMLYRLDATEKLLEQVRLDHERETHYNREQQLRETQLQDQLRKVQSLMVHTPPRKAFTLDADLSHRTETRSLPSCLTEME